MRTALIGIGLVLLVILAARRYRKYRDVRDLRIRAERMHRFGFTRSKHFNTHEDL